MNNSSNTEYVLGFGQIEGSDSDERNKLIRQISDNIDYRSHWNWGNRIDASGYKRAFNM